MGRGSHTGKVQWEMSHWSSLSSLPVHTSSLHLVASRQTPPLLQACSPTPGCACPEAGSRFATSLVHCDSNHHHCAHSQGRDIQAGAWWDPVSGPQKGAAPTVCMSTCQGRWSVESLKFVICSLLVDPAMESQPHQLEVSGRATRDWWED